MTSKQAKCYHCTHYH